MLLTEQVTFHQGNLQRNLWLRAVPLRHFRPNRRQLQAIFAHILYGHHNYVSFNVSSVGRSRPDMTVRGWLSARGVNEPADDCMHISLIGTANDSLHYKHRRPSKASLFRF